MTKTKPLEPLPGLPGLKPRQAALLHKLGIEKAADLLFLYPRQYEDWQQDTLFEEAIDGATVVFTAPVMRAPTVNYYGRRTTVRASLSWQGRTVAALWFNQPWLRDVLQPGASYRFRGILERRGGRLLINNPAFYRLDVEVPPFLAIYPLTAGLTQRVVRDAVQQVLDSRPVEMEEYLPVDLRRRYRLSERRFALNTIHRPQDLHALELALERLKFDELFLARLALAVLRRQRAEKLQAPALPDHQKGLRALQLWRAQLPFKLTAAQERVIGECLEAMQSGRPMHRLLQGDVGSGKTAVASALIVYVTALGGQAAMMAPTAVLAAQHQRTLSGLLAPSGLEPALLTGQTGAAERRRILNGLAEGSIQVVVGTHALIEPAVQFSQLALAVTDEQHRFGVLQRRDLLKTTEDILPHTLVMSATPIPRTLGLILYGDLDVSLLDEMPPGRPDVETYLITSQQWPRLLDLMRKTMAAGRQIFVVCPLIEDSEKMDLAAATTTYNRLGQELPQARLALLHGGQKASTKDQTMQAFVAGEIDVLVSTTVIEVGIDHPNATMMIVENAERFGLAQLHQLRGRIGRGEHKGLCVLISDRPEETARERLTTMTRHRDGFKLAEADLQLRGPGEFFGTRQHGLPPFRLVNLYADRDTMEQAAAAVDFLLTTDPALTHPEHARLLPAVAEQFGDRFARLVL